MVTSKDFLNQLAKKLGGEEYEASDYAIAKVLGVPRATVSRWRTGAGAIGEDNAIAIAEILGEDPKFVLACVLAERSTSKKAKQVLRQIADGLRHTAAMVIVGIAGILGVSHSPTAQASSVNAQESILC